MLQVFQAEYSLMCDIVRCPIPYISICNGIWMGFGVGFAVHGDIRIVTENTVFAMPENMIGLWPDVGFARVAANNAPGMCCFSRDMTRMAHFAWHCTRSNANLPL